MRLVSNSRIQPKQYIRNNQTRNTVFRLQEKTKFEEYFFSAQPDIRHDNFRDTTGIF